MEVLIRYLFKNKRKFFISFFSVSILLNLHTIKDKCDLLNGIKKYDYGIEFLKKHKEDDFCKIIELIKNPKNGYDQIKLIDFFGYIELINRFSSDENIEINLSREFRSFFYDKKELNEKDADLLTYILVKSEGYLTEELIDFYLVFFSRSPYLFLKILPQTDWKRVARNMAGLAWHISNTIVEKFGDSGFEGEFKSYFLSYVEENRKH